jgi:hypothetical protein
MISLNSLGDFMASAWGVNYYNKSPIFSINLLCHTLGHHIGSIAYSIIFFPVLIFKIIFGWIEWTIDSKNPNFL